MKKRIFLLYVFFKKMNYLKTSTEIILFKFYSLLIKRGLQAALPVTEKKAPFTENNISVPKMVCKFIKTNKIFIN